MKNDIVLKLLVLLLPLISRGEKDEIFAQNAERNTTTMVVRSCHNIYKKRTTRIISATNFTTEADSDERIKMINAKQSSTETRWTCSSISCAAEMAIDDVFSFGSVTEYSDVNSWWSAEFTNPATIKNIVLYLSGFAFGQGYYYHFKLETRMSKDESWKVCKGEYDIPDDHTLTHVIQCDLPTKAKYLRLSNRWAPLYLYEVVVTGRIYQPDCIPKIGPKAGQKCIFPFTRKGKTCLGPKCCNLDSDPNGAWCSTKVDSRGEHIYGNFAYCKGASCDPNACFPTTGPKAGQRCIFPFTKNGKTCPGPQCCNLNNDPNGSWCATEVDSSGEIIGQNYAYCKGSSCDQTGPFLLQNTLKSWNEAEHQCEEHNAHLVTLTSEKKLQQLSESTSKYVMGTIWIGLSDIQIEGQWEGVDPRYRRSEYRNWYPGEPNGGRGENCMEMYNHDWDNRWNDKSCSDGRPFACEKGGLRCNGQDNNCCTKENPCGLGDGDCDYDYECAGSLVCGSDGGGKSDNCPWGDYDDCCMENPRPEPTTTTSSPTTSTTTAQPTTAKLTTTSSTTPVSCWVRFRHCLNEGKVTPRECNRRFWECKKHSS